MSGLIGRFITITDYGDSALNSYYGDSALSTGSIEEPADLGGDSEYRNGTPRPMKMGTAIRYLPMTPEPVRRANS